VTLYPDPEIVIAQLTRVGFFVRDSGLLLSSLARPATSLFGEDAYATLALKTAALMDSIVNNHPMTDGNKRSSWFVANFFVELNGYEIVATEDEAFAFILSIATGNQPLERIAAWLENHLNELPRP
jgi:death-on-curing protein